MRCRLTRRYDAARLDAGISRLEPSLWCAAMRMHENRHLEPEARNLVVLPGMQQDLSLHWKLQNGICVYCDRAHTATRIDSRGETFVIAGRGVG